MIQSTGSANAQYLRDLALGGDGQKISKKEQSFQLDTQRRGLASSNWVATAQFALAMNLTSIQNDLQLLEVEGRNDILQTAKDAVVTLQGVLEGKHDEVIEKTLDQYQMPRDRWWSSLYKMVEGMSVDLIICPHAVQSYITLMV